MQDDNIRLDIQPENDKPNNDVTYIIGDERIKELSEEINSLKDLFTRRLMEDKQKTELIQVVKNAAEFAFIEPFLADIILLLDRLDKNDDEFTASVKEELFGIINRRGVQKIEVSEKFDPTIYKAVKVVEDANSNEMYVSAIVRNGYLFSGKVIRPAEVIVTKPLQSNTMND